MELIVFAPIVVALPVLVAVLLSVYGAISVSRWTWIGFIGLSLLAFAQIASLLVFLIAAPLPWPQPKYSGLVVAPVAFVLAIVLAKRGVRITARRRSVVVWTARAGAVALGLVLALAWLVHWVEYKTSSATRFSQNPSVGVVRMGLAKTAAVDEPCRRPQRVPTVSAACPTADPA